MPRSARVSVTLEVREHVKYMCLLLAVDEHKPHVTARSDSTLPYVASSCAGRFIRCFRRGAEGFGGCRAFWMH